jgi:hypothetical protein
MNPNRNSLLKILSAPIYSEEPKAEKDEVSKSIDLDNESILKMKKQFLSTQNAINWITSQKNFENLSTETNFLQITMIISSAVDKTLKDIQLKHFLDNEYSIFISIESKEEKNQRKFFWRVQGLNEIYSLEVNDGFLADSCQNFLIAEIHNCRTGNTYF